MTRIAIQDHETYEIYQVQDKYDAPLPRIGERIELVLQQPKIVGVKNATEFVKVIDVIHHVGPSQEIYCTILVSRK